MSSPSASSGSAPPPAKPGAPAGGLDYLRSYQYVFDNPEWTMVLLWAALLALIPIAGPLVLFGYMFFVIDALLESRGTRFPVLDLNRFVDYLMRGLWPVLAALVVGLFMAPILFLLYLVMFVAFFVVRAAAGDEAAGFVMVIMMLLIGLVAFVLSFALNIVTIPLLLRAGLSQDFVEAFKFDWIKDFVRKMWLETLLAILFLIVSSTALTLVGFLACCVGVYFAQALVVMAYGHMLYQLYALYLSRGGTPVYPKPKSPAVV